MDGAITGATNITLSGELDAATLDISGNADIDGTLEADAITINGTAIGSIYGVVAGSSSIVTTGALDSGSITSGFGTIDTGSSAITTTGLISGGSLDIDDVLINGTTIGHTDDTDLLTLTSGVLTVAGELDATTLDISGNADIDGTTNLDAVDIDGAVQLDATLTVGVDDTGYDVKFFGATSGSYMLWDESTDDLILAGAAKLYLYDAAGGEYISSSGSALTIASGGTAWELPTSDGSANQLLKTDGSGNLDWTTVSGTITALNNQSANRLTTIGSTTTELDGEANLSFTGSALTCIGTITVGVDDTGHDVKFFGATSGAYMLWDESADDLVLAGAAGIDLAGDIDVDGTANLDAVDIDGAVQIDNTVTVGVDDTGYDVKFFGDTASAYMLWDTSADDLILGGAAGLIVPDGQLTLGSTAVSSTASELNLLDGGTSVGSSITLADADGIVVNDGGTMKTIPASDLKTYNPGGTSWQSVITGATTMVSGRGYFVNTTSSAFTMTLPASPSIGDSVTIIDYAGTFDSNNCTVGRNSEKIHGASEDLTVATERAAFTLVYTDSTQGWLLTNN